MQNRSKVAASLKQKGNGAYSKKEYEKAAEYYTKAIEVTPIPEPVYFSNRAACEQLKCHWVVHFVAQTFGRLSKYLSSTI